MKAVSLCSGIGGLDIGFSAAGFNIIAQVEIDQFCRRVLERHAPEWWPNATQFADVRGFGRASVIGDIDVVFGGIPCQPFSSAGKRLGAADNRNLWPEFRRIIGELRPRCVLLENVPAILTRYAAVIIGDLAALGYDAQWGIISAADAGAPHLRKRWFCVAYAQECRTEREYSIMGTAKGKPQHDGNGTVHRYPPLDDTKVQRRPIKPGQANERALTGNDHPPLRSSYVEYSPCAVCQRKTAGRSNQDRLANTGNTVGDTQSTGLPERRHRPHKNRRTARKAPTDTSNTRSHRPGSSHRTSRHAQCRLGRTVTRIPAWLDKPRWPAHQGAEQYEWEAPRTIAKGTDKNRTARIKALGNAVIPQIAYALALEIKGYLDD